MGELGGGGEEKWEESHVLKTQTLALSSNVAVNARLIHAKWTSDSACQGKGFEGRI